MNDRPDLIQRKRLGEIRHFDPQGNFGFIEAEDFRNDVFFHKSVWENRGVEPEIKTVVEFELDQGHLKDKGELRAKVVRITERPYTQQLYTTDERLKVKHHPKAKKRKPNWRRKD